MVDGTGGQWLHDGGASGWFDGGLPFGQLRECERMSMREE